MIARISTIVMAIMACAQSSCVKAPIPKYEPIEIEIDEETIAAFTKAGGQFGHFEVTLLNGIEFRPGKPHPGTISMPAVMFWTLPREPLPVVKVPFGICLPYIRNRESLAPLYNQTNLAGIAGAFNKSTSWLECLSNFPNLTMLELRSDAIGVVLSDSELEVLSSFEGLRHLQLSSHDGGRALKYVGKLARLESFHFQPGHKEIKREELMQLSQLRRLDCFSTLGIIPTEDIIELAVDLQIRKLNLADRVLSEENTRQIEKINGLTELGLSGTQTKSHRPGPMILPLVPTLKKLSISRWSEGFANVNLPSLLRGLSAMSEITHLDVSQSTILDRSILQVIGNMPKLQAINLKESHLKNSDFPLLAKSTSLKSIGLQCAHGTNDDTLRSLSEMSQLEHIAIGCHEHTDTGLSYLSRLSLLRRVDYMLGSFSPDGVRSFQAAVPRCAVNLYVYRIDDWVESFNVSGKNLD